MAKTETQGLLHLSRISLPYLMFSVAYATTVLLVEERLGDKVYYIPGQLGAVFGLAVAFFLGFRMNSAYDRWWEARKIFGQLTNTSRGFVTKIYAYLNSSRNFQRSGSTDHSQEVKELIDLVILYVRQLKSEIHEVSHPQLDESTEKFLVACGVDVNEKVTNEILIAIAVKLERLAPASAGIVKYDLMQFVNRFFDIQGMAERINNTPFLKIYGAFTRIVVLFYVLLIPFFVGDIDLGGENSNLEFLAIPILAAISTAFLTINRLANLYGEPLGENKTSVPIDSICEAIVGDCLAVKSKLVNEASSVESPSPDSPHGQPAANPNKR